MVFITQAGGSTKPAIVDLGSAKLIDERIAQFRSDLGKIEAGDQPDNDREIRRTLSVLRKLIIDPALSQIRGRRHWIICPDGQISLVPFERLPIADDKYLIEDKKISYLGAGREAAAYIGPSQDVGLTRAVLIGNPDFDMSPEDQLSELRQVEARSHS